MATSRHWPRLQRVVTETYGLQPGQFNPDTSLDDLAANESERLRRLQVSAVEFVLGVEDEFGVSLSDDVLEHFKRIRDFLDYLDEHVR